jgi:hypothetical protein
MRETRTPDKQGSQTRIRVWAGVVAVVVLLVMVVTVWVVVYQRGDVPEQASPGNAGVATASATPTASPSPSPADPSSSEPSNTATPGAASAAVDGFLARATMADQALRAASARINAAMTTTEVTYDQRTSDLLESAAPERIAATLPPGMPDTLQKAALLVYSDLVSRWAAMSGSCDHGVGTFPRADFEGCFAQGASAADRFAGDLAALTALAAKTPEFTVVAPDSRPAEELAVRVRYISLGNLGCASKGGYVATDAIPIRWQTNPDQAGGPDWQGTVGPPGAGIPFRGTFDPAFGWQIDLLAC